MTDTNPSQHSALLMLIERLSQAQVEQGRAQVKQTEEQHAIKVLLTELASDLKPLRTIGSDLTALRMETSSHAVRIVALEADAASHQSALAALQTAHDKRSGWEGIGGKFLYLVGGALIPIALGALLFFAGRARAEAPLPTVDTVGDKCWAVPAGRRRSWMWV